MRSTPQAPSDLRGVVVLYGFNFFVGSIHFLVDFINCQAELRITHHQGGDGTPEFPSQLRNCAMPRNASSKR